MTATGSSPAAAAGVPGSVRDRSERVGALLFSGQEQAYALGVRARQ